MNASLKIRYSCMSIPDLQSELATIKNRKDFLNNNIHDLFLPISKEWKWKNELAELAKKERWIKRLIHEKHQLQLIVNRDQSKWS